MPKEGEMTEYGWYEQCIEDEIMIVQILHHCNRDQAIVKVFGMIPDKDNTQNE